MAVDRTRDPRAGSELKQTSDAGVSGSAAVQALNFAVATATGEERNTLILPLRPTACWSMGDVRFAFDSSFLAPSAAEEFGLLAATRENGKRSLQGQDVYPPLTIFGHADPVGQDEYNKQLSGRRARAVYAALVRDTAAWEELYSQSISGDDWGLRSLQTMLNELGYLAAGSSGAQGAEMEAAVRVFQQDEGLAVDGQAGPQTRAKLFERYMDLLCGPDLRLSKTGDFLARGADAGGKGDYQGCSEFNPVLMFSSAENEEMNRPEQQAERNAQNAPNRRVLALLFAPGDRVDSALWPCPRAAEASAGCRKRFWSDAATRRSFQQQRRLYEVTRDTFACRFYQLLVEGSPCERALAVLRVRLHDRLGRKMPGVQYEVEYAGRTRSGRADAQGFLTETLDPAAEQCTIRWEPAAAEANGTDAARDSASAQSSSSPQEPPAPGTAAPDSGFLHELTVFVPLLDINTDEGVKRRLHNLGYPLDGDFETNLRAFQAHHELDITGQVDDATKAKLRSIYAPALDQWVQPENPGPSSVPETEQRT